MNASAPARFHPGVQLLIAGLPVIALLTGLGLWLAWTSYENERAADRRETEAQAVAVSAEVGRYLEERVDILEAMAVGPAIRTLNLDEMWNYLQVGPQASGFNGGAGWADARGNLVVVAGRPREDAPVDLSDRGYVQEVLRRGAPVVGPAVLGRLDGVPLLPIAVPTYDDAGTLTGALIGTVRLDGADGAGDSLRFGDSPWVRVIDGEGNLVIGSGPVPGLASVAAWPGYAEARAQGSGVFTDVPGLEAPGMESRGDRVIGYATVPTAGWLVVVDRPASEVYATARDNLRTNVVLIATFAVVSLAGLGWSARGLERQARRESGALLAQFEARGAAEDALRNRDEFIGAIVHDLRTPLTVIRGFTQLMARPGASVEVREQGLQEIDRAARRLGRMVEQLVDIQRYGEERLELNREPVDIVALVADALAEQQPLAPGVKFVFEHDVPRLVGDWDGARLERLVHNLVSNAVKYSHGRGEVFVSLSREGAEVAEGDDEGGVAVLQVRDSGIGIPEADLPHLFERFRRASNVGAISGSGLGLASVKQVAEEHGGSVVVTSVEGGGATFVVRLPLFGPADEDAAPLEDGSEEAEEEPASRAEEPCAPAAEVAPYSSSRR